MRAALLGFQVVLLLLAIASFWWIPGIALLLIVAAIAVGVGAFLTSLPQQRDFAIAPASDLVRGLLEPSGKYAGLITAAVWFAGSLALAGLVTLVIVPLLGLTLLLIAGSAIAFAAIMGDTA